MALQTNLFACRFNNDVDIKLTPLLTTASELVGFLRGDTYSYTSYGISL